MATETDASPKHLLTKEHFTRHGKACRVYNFHDEYKALHTAAISKGSTIEKELELKGYKDLSSFYVACPKFKLTCWPSQLGELGSGVVLYFHFLSFCVTVLFISFLVQIPAVVEYSGADRLSAWTWDARGFTTGEIDSCEKCLGSNDGYFGVGTGSQEQRDYGTSCKAWDHGWCSLGIGSPFLANETGKWCCKSWCYVSKDCPTTQNEDSPSESNRRVMDRDLVRSYVACPQPDPALALCETGDFSREIAFPREKHEDPATGLNEGFMTSTGPGNLGPDKGDNGSIFIVYLVFIIFFCFAVIVKHQYQIRTISKVDVGTVQPNDFAVLVEDLPATAYDEKQISEFFREHGCEGKTDTEIVKVVIGWESKEYRNNMREMKYLKKKLLLSMAADSMRCCGWCITLEPVESIVSKLTEVQKRIRTSAPDMGDIGRKILSSGSVVVIFRHQKDHRECLNKWGPNMWGFRKSDLPPYHWAKIRVRRAPNPKDVLWEDLGVSWQERMKMLSKTNGIMLLMIIISAAIVYGLTKLKEASKGKGILMSTLPVLGIAICNTCIMMAAKKFGEDEYHKTKAEQTASISLKMAVAMLANTAGIIFFANAQPKEWYVDGGLVTATTTLLLFTGTIQPLMLLWDAKYTIAGLTKRATLTDSLLKDLNEQTASLEGQRPTTREEAIMHARQKNQIQKQIMSYEKAFEPSEMEMVKRYAYAVRTFVCCMLYSPLAPLMPLVGIVGLSTQYWVDKYMLLRWCKRPSEPHPGELAVDGVLFVRAVLALFLPVACFVFIHPSWADVSRCWFWFGIWIAIGIGYLIFPLKVWRTCFCLRWIPGLSGKSFKVQDGDDEQPDYYTAQHFWPKDMKYHKSQFLYAMVPESKNPEILTLGKDSATKDFKVSVEAGAAAAADAAGTESTPTTVIAVAGHGDVALKKEISTLSASVPPPAPGDGDGGGDAGTGGAVEPLAVAASIAPGGEPPKPKIVWEFQVRRGWSPFGDDAQGYIEQRYQEYNRKGGKSRVRVFTMGISVSIDFEKMTQKVGERGGLRDIRRIEPP